MRTRAVFNVLGDLWFDELMCSLHGLLLPCGYYSRCSLGPSWLYVHQITSLLKWFSTSCHQCIGDEIRQSRGQDSHLHGWIPNPLRDGGVWFTSLFINFSSRVDSIWEQFLCETGEKWSWSKPVNSPSPGATLGPSSSSSSSSSCGGSFTSSSSSVPAPTIIIATRLIIDQSWSPGLLFLTNASCALQFLGLPSPPARSTTELERWNMSYNSKAIFTTCCWNTAVFTSPKTTWPLPATPFQQYLPSCVTSIHLPNDRFWCLHTSQLLSDRIGLISLEDPSTITLPVNPINTLLCGLDVLPIPEVKCTTDTGTLDHIWKEIYDPWCHFIGNLKVLAWEWSMFVALHPAWISNWSHYRWGSGTNPLPHVTHPVWLSSKMKVCGAKNP